MLDISVRLSTQSKSSSRVKIVLCIPFLFRLLSAFKIHSMGKMTMNGDSGMTVPKAVSTYVCSPQQTGSPIFRAAVREGIHRNAIGLQCHLRHLRSVHTNVMSSAHNYITH